MKYLQTFLARFDIQFFPHIWVLRIFVLTTVLLAILAGYYQAALVSEQKKYLRLEDRYVRVRSELGREETQRLIDLSRENQEKQY